MKTYTIRSTGRSEIAAALCKYCAFGKPGQSLIENGCNQRSFSLFVAKVAFAYMAKKATEQQLADCFDLLSACNASAARQALADCALKIEGEEKEISVSSYWAKHGKIAAPNLALLDL